MNTSPVKESLPDLPKPMLWLDSVGIRGYTANIGAGPWFDADQMRQQFNAGREFEAELALQAIAAPREGWQPISTAPKDQFLLLAAEFDGPGDWRIKMGEYRSQADEHGRHWHLMGASWTPTRWHELPAAPLAVEATEK